METTLDFAIGLNTTLVFEWFVVECGSKNGYQKEIGLDAQNLITILNSIVLIIRGFI